MSIQTILIEYLLEHGPTDTVMLSIKTDVPAETAGRVLRALREYGRWGVYRQGFTKYHGRDVGVWAIDRKRYEAFLDKAMGRPKGVKETKPRNRVYQKGIFYGNVKKEKPPRVFNTPYKTIWQPASPYYRGATA